MRHSLRVSLRLPSTTGSLSRSALHFLLYRRAKVLCWLRTRDAARKMYPAVRLSAPDEEGGRHRDLQGLPCRQVTINSGRLPRSETGADGSPIVRPPAIETGSAGTGSSALPAGRGGKKVTLIRKAINAIAAAVIAIAAIRSRYHRHVPATLLLSAVTGVALLC